MGWPFDRLLNLPVLTLLVSTLLCFVLGTPAWAFPEPVDFDGSLSRWDIGPGDGAITYGIEADGVTDADGYQSAVDEAAALWNQVPGSYFRYAKVEDGKEPQVTIQLQSSLNGTRSTAGYTYFDKYSGDKPVHCMIVVLIDDSVSYSSIAKTFLHEMGHGLGLGHSLIPEAIMSYSLRKNSFNLDVDDDAAVARLYPISGHKPRLPPGCSIGAAAGGQSAGAKQRVALALLLALPLVLSASRLSQSRASGRSPA